MAYDGYSWGLSVARHLGCLTPNAPFEFTARAARALRDRRPGRLCGEIIGFRPDGFVCITS